MSETTRSADNPEQKAEIEGGVESGEEGNSRERGETGGKKEEEIRKLVGEESTGKALEVVNVEEEESADDGETLSERAIRRSFRTPRGLNGEELRSMQEEAAVLAAAKREAAERKRKGKRVATTSQSRKSRPTSLGVVIREVIANPTKSLYYHEEEQHVGEFERVEIDLDQKLLEAMIQFDDPKLRRNCAGRVSELRPAQSGRRIHYPSLQMIGVKEKFVGYIRGIGFGWLLEHAPCEVPVNLAKEFFTSFDFEYTTNLDEESIHFRIFNQKMVMSLREWSLRLGMLSHEEDKRGDWYLREIGQPKCTEEFNAEEAWDLIGAKGANPFKTSESTGEEIAGPVLRMTHFFLANNLLGHNNTTVTTIELYFMWCI